MRALAILQITKAKRQFNMQNKRSCMEGLGMQQTTFMQNTRLCKKRAWDVPWAEAWEAGLDMRGREVPFGSGCQQEDYTYPHTRRCKMTGGCRQEAQEARFGCRKGYTGSHTRRCKMTGGCRQARFGCPRDYTGSHTRRCKTTGGCIEHLAVFWPHRCSRHAAGSHAEHADKASPCPL